MTESIDINNRIDKLDLECRQYSRKIELEINSFYGMASNTSNKEKMVLFLRFIGSKSLCLIPVEIFLIYNQWQGCHCPLNLL